MVLSNFEFKLSGQDLTRLEDLQVMMTLTGTRDEEWFYMISVAAEARGAPLSAASFKCMEAMHERDDHGVASTVQSLAAVIRDLTTILYQGVHFGILPHDVFYDVGNGQGQWRKYSGGSNAQSALIRFLDIVLGVTHLGKEESAPYPTSAMSPPAIGGLLEENENLHAPRAPRLPVSYRPDNKFKEYITRYSVCASVKQAYDDAVEALVSFRSVHIQIAARFIIQPSKCSRLLPHKELPGTETAPPNRPNLHGTGGTEFMSFLKKSRDETRQAAFLPLEQGSRSGWSSQKEQ
ncbi:hypothetical protein PV11_00018 [Exophiala sideris]|uniref:Indoleamine 2,3-dioxygenase n=1 Tax=Exophiala sideris TaxID=1016849 RepID=A0A0D1YMT4_9EURO|nr:hypothetical protein PV11_00018 [Exophiala sideris]